MKFFRIPLITLFLLRSHSSLAIRKRPVTLLTFDVDGTLIQGSSQAAQVSAHARAFCHAVGKIFGNINNWEKEVPSPPAIIPFDRYHGSTDGIIALNLAYYGFKIDPEDSFAKLNLVFEEMYKYVAALSDEEVAKGIDVLQGVTTHLTELASNPKYNNGKLLIGLVTGNVEGIARKKMRAVGLLKTKAFSEKAVDQTWSGENDHAFLGGFGSCYCSGNINDPDRIFKDRGEQLLIAIRRARSCLKEDQELVRVVHIGDAPADILAAKYCSETLRRLDDNLQVGMVAVATGKFSANDLNKFIGVSDQYWDPVVLPLGMGDPDFINYCKIIVEDN